MKIRFYVPGLLDDCQGLGGCHGLHHEEGLGYLVQIPVGLERVPLDGGLGGVGVFTVEGGDWSSQLLSVEESRFQRPMLDDDDWQVVAAQIKISFS